MRNIISSTLLVALLGAIAWSYLDYQHHMKLVEDMMKTAEEQARADNQAQHEAQLRSQAQIKRHAQLRIELAQCQAEAEKLKKVLLDTHQKADPRHSGEFTISRSIVETSEKLVVDEKEKCFKTFEVKLREQ